MQLEHKDDQAVKLRCPKCGQQNLYVVTRFTEARACEVNKGRITMAYSTGEMPDFIRADAKCEDCKHRWHPRSDWDDPPSAHGVKCPRCGKPAELLFAAPEHPGDELDTKHCGCLYVPDGVKGGA